MRKKRKTYFRTLQLVAGLSFSSKVNQLTSTTASHAFDFQYKNRRSKRLMRDATWFKNTDRLSFIIRNFKTSFISLMARLCCPIEMEPRTLNEGQLNHAREAAVDMVQKMEYNEASNVFIEGLRPVVSIKEMEQMVDQGKQQQQAHKLVDCKETGMERTYNCACTSDSTSEDESPIDQKSLVREPLSAPF